MPNDQTTPSSTDGLNPSQQNTPEFTLNLDTNDIAPSPVKTEPVIEPIIEKTPEPITEIKPESTPISTDGLNPSPEANPAPEIKSDFQKDQEIITQIQSTDGLNPSPIETLQAKSLQQSTPISTSINLDDIFGNTPAPQTAPQGIPQNIPMINPVTQQPITQQTVLPAFAPQGNIYQTAPQFSLGQATTFAKDNKKLIINIGIGIMIALVGIFVIKTMYPLGTKTNISSPQDILAANPSSTDDS